MACTEQGHNVPAGTALTVEEKFALVRHYLEESARDPNISMRKFSKVHEISKSTFGGWLIAYLKFVSEGVLPRSNRGRPGLEPGKHQKKRIKDKIREDQTEDINKAEKCRNSIAFEVHNVDEKFNAVRQFLREQSEDSTTTLRSFAKSLRVSPSTFRGWKKAYQEFEDHGVLPRNNFPGRPRLVDDIGQQSLKRKIEELPNEVLGHSEFRDMVMDEIIQTKRRKGLTTEDMPLLSDKTLRHLKREIGLPDRKPVSKKKAKKHHILSDAETIFPLQNANM